MEIGITRNYITTNYNFSISRKRKLYSLAVLQLAMLDLKMLKNGVIRLIHNFNSWYGISLMGFNITGVEVLIGAIILAYLFNIEILQKKNWKDVLLSVLITVIMIIITIL